MNKHFLDLIFFDFKIERRHILSIISVGLIISFSARIEAQKITILTPENSAGDIKFAGKLSDDLSKKLKLINSSLSETVFRAAGFENPFNLSIEESKNVGTAIGSDFFLLVKSLSTRRESLDKPAYYESYAAIYVVSSRTGRLIFWKLESRQAEKPAEAEKLLFDSTGNLANEICEKVNTADKIKLFEKPPAEIEEMPAENTAESKNLHVPLPYRRLKPVYTPTAYFYDIKATVDITVDVGADGQILRTEISRWAGFGLDESVIETVRKMNWRAAERNGKTLPMRVLLRYNFKKIEREENP